MQVAFLLVSRIYTPSRGAIQCFMGSQSPHRLRHCAVVFLVSDDAKNIAGQVLHVVGGEVMR